ncbi:YbbR domain-containing protein [Natronincola peptidivorans]|uniref:YbbR domain-containing protein n=1 Tax=Natronincola peptidivorans TaxID=426128 RepID=A0A1I0C0P4_9FIRM|nr:CdaR family protein [Natronincola peptidivorans]SET12292.1 YbbR domain-containing protein [Natronincola peptidivorans]
MNKFNRSNLTPKIISIFFALTIWIYVMSEINPRITRDEQNVPVEFINIEEMRQAGFVIKGEADETIRVRITGRRDEVHRIARGQIEVKADILGYRPGVNNIPLEVSVPGEVEVDFNPKLIRIELEEIISRQKPVNVNIEGTPRRGYVLGELDYQPTAVWVEGPESLVNAVEVVQANIKLSEEFENINTRYPLKPINSRGEEIPNVSLQTAYVNINIPIDQLKTVSVNPVVETMPAAGYEISSISVEPTTINIRGQQEIVNLIEYINTETIVIDNIDENISRRIALDLPEGITVIDTPEVTLSIEVDPIVERNFEIAREDIEFRNVAAGVEVDKSEIPAVLQVRISATETLLDTVEAAAINIVINMEGLEQNQYTIEPVVEMPFLVERRAKQIQLIPQSVNVKVVSIDNET